MHSHSPTLALLWDESFLWGLMAYKSLRGLGVDVGIVTAEEVRAGALAGYGALFVPGGWASDKTVALGPEGAEAVREFVRSGGGYIGMCGGAGLALAVDGGLGLVPASRIPTKDRVPSFSGRIEVVPEDRRHDIWYRARRPFVFHAWWPGQFHIGDAEGVRVVARYGKPGRDFAIADLSYEDMEAHSGDWHKWEKSYGINLNPDRIVGEPAIIEADYGDGVAFLSYPHLETPGCAKGNSTLDKAIYYVAQPMRLKPAPEPPAARYPVTPEAKKAAQDMLFGMVDLVSLGKRNFLWYWRNDWMLHWRRGVRGMEYAILHGLVREIASYCMSPGQVAAYDISPRVVDAREMLMPFIDDAKRLLLLERHAMMHGGMSSISSHDADVLALRERLFSKSKRFGGEFKRIIDLLGGVVLDVLRGRAE